MLPNFDPSKMDPKVLMELSRLIQELPPEHLNRMQSIMHNTMAGFDTRKEMEEFEKNLPPGFRVKLATLMASHGEALQSAAENAVASQPASSAAPADMNLREARLTILRAVADGSMVPEEAERLLFPN